MNEQIGFSPEGFANKHGLLTELLPFQHKQRNPIELLREFDAAVDGLHECQATILPRTVFNTHMRGYNADVCHTILLLRGCYPIRDAGRRSAMSSRWVLPRAEAEHQPNCAVPIEQHIDDCLRLGSVTTTEIAKRYGLSPRTVQERVSDWKARRTRGRARLVQTCMTIKEWTGTPLTELSELCGYHPRTLHRAKSRLEHEFDAPSQPGGKR